MKGHLNLAAASCILFVLFGTVVVGLKLPGQTKEAVERGKEGRWGHVAPTIPIWSFLRRHPGDGSTSQNHIPTRSNLHENSKMRGSSQGTAYASDTSSDSDEITRAEDLASVLSSKARLLNNSKRSPSYSSSGDLSRKTDDLKRSRPYDVPLIECPLAEDGMERFSCPTPDSVGRYRCVDDHVLCDGFTDCPNAEDEDRQACMFYKTTKAHLDVLADALLRWARGR